MTCEAWREKLDQYADGELAPAESAALAEHLPSCNQCATDVLARVQMKRSVAAAGARYQPSAQLRAKVASSIVRTPRRRSNWWWWVIAVPALSVVVVSVAVSLYVQREEARRRQTFSELTDMHVALLASSAPFDVVSSDRHTVKPWFQTKLPFTFNLPELQGSDFTLLGGRVTYFDQRPGAHLIYQLRKHEISVFVFQDAGSHNTGLENLPARPVHALSFNLETWTQDGLRYFVVGNVSPNDIDALSQLLRGAG